MHLVGCTVRIYYDARIYELQIKNGIFASYCQAEQPEVRIMAVGTETVSETLVYLNEPTRLPALQHNAE